MQFHVIHEELFRKFSVIFESIAYLLLVDTIKTANFACYKLLSRTSLSRLYDIQELLGIIMQFHFIHKELYANGQVFLDRLSLSICSVGRYHAKKLTWARYGRLLFKTLHFAIVYSIQQNSMSCALKSLLWLLAPITMPS